MIPDEKIARVFATPEGRKLMDEPWEVLTREQIEAAIRRMRERWRTGDLTPD